MVLMMKGLHLSFTTAFLMTMGSIHRNDGNSAFASSFFEQTEERDYLDMRKNQRNRNLQGQFFERKQAVSLSEVLFPEDAPKDYEVNEEIDVSFDHHWVTSRNTLLPFSFSSLFCQQESSSFRLKVLNNEACQVWCEMEVTPEHVRQWHWLIEKHYRVHLTLDGLPVLMRNAELNYAVRGYPIGWRPVDHDGGDVLQQQEQPPYMFNHLQFVITYHQDPKTFAGSRITSFDVQVSSRNYDQKEARSATSSSSSRSAGSACPEILFDNRSSHYQLPSNMMGATGKRAAPSFEEQRSALVHETRKIIFTYEVEWVASGRWDIYLIGMPDDDIHYFSIFNSLMTVIILVAFVASILNKTLKQDIDFLKTENAAVTNHNDDRPPEGHPAQKGTVSSWCAALRKKKKKDDTGWKLIHQDVFRPPPQNMLLLVLVGTGVQVSVTILVTLTKAILQLVNPLKRDAVMSSVTMSYILCGSVVGGCVAGRFANFFVKQGPTTKYSAGDNLVASIMVINENDEGAWKTLGLAIGMGLPTFLAVLLLIQDFIFRSHHTANLIPLSTWTRLVCLLCFINTPLVLLGTYIGYTQFSTFSVPTKTQAVPRQIPSTLPLFMRFPMLPALATAILPFGSLNIELFFMMSALWLDQIYYQTGILLMVVIICICTSALASMVFCFLQLKLQDYRWWWISFWNTFTMAVYVFLYGIYFWAFRLEITDAASTCAYLIYMTMMAIVFGLACGSIGFVSCFFFCRTIYGAVKETLIQ